VVASEITQLTWIAVAGVVAPVVALRSRRPAVPGVVIELVLGVLLGPSVLGWISPTGLVLDFSNFGLALLMFLAGLELLWVPKMSSGHDANLYAWMMPLIRSRWWIRIASGSVTGAGVALRGVAWFRVRCGRC
jgi:hypothetical protein